MVTEIYVRFHIIILNWKDPRYNHRNCTILYCREKDDLWHQKEQLELELSTYRERPAERWITDTEVARCPKCTELFSLTRRKVSLNFKSILLRPY